MNNQTDDTKNHSEIAVNANSSANAGNNDRDENGLHTGETAPQTPAEYDNDKNKDHSKNNNTITESALNDLKSTSDGAAGTDIAGTNERKTSGDTELNKGLESQAKDGESL